MIATRNHRGDTLIEVTVALAILGALLVITYGLATRLFNLGRSASEHTQISNLMQAQAELFSTGLNNQPTGGTPQQWWDYYRTVIIKQCNAANGDADSNYTNGCNAISANVGGFSPASVTSCPPTCNTITQLGPIKVLDGQYTSKNPDGTRGLFTITTTAAYAPVAEIATGVPTDKIIFHMVGTWTDASGGQDTTTLDFFQANVLSTPVAP